MRRSLTLPLLLAAAGCAVNPATGERQLSLIGRDQEIAMGRQADSSVVSSIGIVDDPALESYVSGIGRSLAAVSERPDLPWSFKIVDDPAVNAFALPGGFIFVTRGILADLDTEAELAGVMGHEIGHVTARHSVTQMSRQQLQQLGLGVGMILSQDVRKYQGLLSGGLGLLNLKYSRDDESQADALGFRYMTRDGYDPHALLGVFEMLAGVSGGSGSRVPEWQSTHPYPENREEHINKLLEEDSLPATGKVDRNRYLENVDGIVYGENPREGYFKASLFVHPDLKFQLRFPDGWKGVNQRSAVGAVSPGQDAVVVLEPAQGTGTASAALQSFLGQDGVSGGTVRQEDHQGISVARATFSAKTSDGEIQGEVAFLRYGGALYRILGYASPSAWPAYSRVVSETLGSFEPLTDPAVLGVQPWHLRIVRIDRAMTLTEFNQRYPPVVSMAELARLNRVGAQDRLEAGTRVKRVEGRPLP